MTIQVLGKTVTAISVCFCCSKRETVEMPDNIGIEDSEQFDFVCNFCETFLDEELKIFSKGAFFKSEGFDGRRLKGMTSRLIELAKGYHSPEAARAATDLIKALTKNYQVPQAS